MNGIIFRLLTLADKRALIQVNKQFYWWIKPHLEIFTVPRAPDATFTAGHCQVCYKIHQKETGQRMNRVRIRSNTRLDFVECSHGHRTVCHAHHVGDYDGACPVENCPHFILPPPKKRRKKVLG